MIALDQGAFGPYGLLILAFTLAAAWLSTDLLIPWVTRAAKRLGTFDPVDARKVHTQPIPRLGGIAIFLGVVLSVGLVELVTPGQFFPAQGPMRGIFAGATVVFLLGVVDDLRPLSARVKLFGQLGAAGLAWLLGCRIEFLSNPQGGLWVLGLTEGLPLLSIAITVIWLVGISNTINLIDGLDGLAAGVSLIGGLTLAIIALETNQPMSAVIALAVVGATIGFLRYNFNPAKIFMGDGGSLFLGFVLAAISILGVLKLVTAVTLLLPLLILGVPIFDTAFAIVRRLWNRRPIFSPDRGHLHHRLLSAGLSHRNAVIMIYGFSLLLAGTALVLLKVQGALPMFLAAGLFLAWGVGSVVLARPHGQPAPAEPPPSPAPATTAEPR